ncbi:MAG: prenyltransferase/squalene oxidase repeat-containing protein, partial [Pirellulaceae bacterium]
KSIELGLAFLARYQKEEGHWSLDQFAHIDSRPSMVSDSAATGLAVMAFQGAGYTHTQFKYKDALRAAMDYLVKHQDKSGDYYFAQGSEANQVARLYSHAIVTLALCEAYGMTQDPDLRDSVQKGLDFIVEAQHPERGGWRYTPGRESDTSVSGWMVTALESGRRAGLEVPDEALEKATSWLNRAQDPDQEYLYRYNPFAPDTVQQGHHRVVSKTMTSVGLLMRLYRGWKVSDPRAIEGAEYLKKHLPSIGRTKSGSLRDTYYWYYATQFMFHMGGDYWKAWNDRLYPILLNSQITRGDLAGSWDPRLPVPDRWGPHAGRIYLTTMNLLSLEVHYRYLPLYDEEPFQPEVADGGK